MRPTVQLTSPFDEAQAKQLLEPGENSIQGSALVRQQGGGIVTCAGSDIWLIPVTAYSTERMGHIYKSDQKGFSKSGAPNFEPNSAAFHNSMRKTLGDAQGNFEFDKVADGDFYVVTVISWVVGYSTQGGSLMQRVSVAGGETKKIVLSP
jgi:hypothetical protein